MLETMDLAGVHTRKEPKRFYPNGSLAANVLGFVGLDGNGLAGIEQVYNEKITGEPGKLFIEKDSRGRAYESTEVAGRPGQTIILTIDQSIQYQAEAALTAAIEQSGAKAGTAIVLDPHTGEILALANAPTFDPNDVGAASPAARNNWALQNIYEPGSTFKVVAFSAAIEKGTGKARRSHRLPDGLDHCRQAGDSRPPSVWNFDCRRRARQIKQRRRDQTRPARGRPHDVRLHHALWFWLAHRN